MDDRIDLTVLGRRIGTCTGWDSVDELTHVYYDFIPLPDVGIPQGDLGVVYGDGRFEVYDDEGGITFSADVIETIKHMEKDL